jgi:glycosyltransferase involved in cell wall biosynthesis
MQLNVWIIEVGEPIPLPGLTTRTMRAGQLASQLVKDGVDVTWWVSDYNHSAKEYHNLNGLDGEGRLRTLTNGTKVYFLHGRPYKNNIDIYRALHNLDIARNFRKAATTLSPPNIIICCFPTIELADAATNYGNIRGIPVVVDIRDLWPDVFLDILPLPRWLSYLLIWPLRLQASRSLRRATAISAISEPILDWGLHKAGRPKNKFDHVFPLSYQRTEPSIKHRINAVERWRFLGLKCDGSEQIFCCFGTLSHVPEFETLLEALALLPEPLAKTIRVVICGAGPRLAWLQKMSRIYPQLLVPGYVGSDAIEAVMPYANGGLLLYPSRKDLSSSYPNKIGEYLSAGLPIISTLGGISAELLISRRCGIVVKNHDAKNFAVAMSRLAKKDDEWQILSSNAIQTFHDKFDAKTNYAKMSNFLIDISNFKVVEE